MDSPQSRPRGLRFHAGAASVAVLLALAVTWPLATDLARAFPSRHAAGVGAPPPAGADQLLTAWILASNARRLAADPLDVFDTNNMHPFRRTLAFSENFLGATLPVWPVQAIGNNPVLTANLALLFTLALSAYGVLLLVHELTGSVGAALAAATLATYSPLVWGRLDQLHVVTGQSAALAFFALVRVVRTRAWRYAVLLGVFTAWQALASLHWGVFLALGLATAVLVLLVTSGEARRALPQIAVGAALAGVLVAPLAPPYLALIRDMDLEDRGFVSFLPSPRAAFPPFAHGFAYLAERLFDGRRAGGTTTLAVWVGIAAGLFASVAGRRPRLRAAPLVVAIAAGTFLAFWLACGALPALGLPNLYRILSVLPGLGIVRVPARAIAYCGLMLSVLAGCGIGALLHRLRSPVARCAVVASVIALGIVEAGWYGAGLAPAPTRGVPVAPPLARLPADCALAEVPSDFAVQALALFRSTGHWRPLLNGRSGFYPVSVFAESTFLNRFPEDASLAYLRAAGVCGVLVRLDDPRSGRMIRQSRARGLRPRNLPLDYNAMLVVLGDTPAAPPPAIKLPRDGWRIVEPPGDVREPLDGSLETMRTFRVGGPEEPERLTVDLGAPSRVAGVELALGHHFRRYLWSHRVEGSEDGRDWVTLAEAPIAIPPFESYRVDPTRLVQRIDFAPTTVRFLRVGPYRQPPRTLAPDVGFTTWGVAEMDVLAPPADS